MQEPIQRREALNSAARSELQAAVERARFVQKSYPLGDRPNFNCDKALEAAAAIEDEELGRKIASYSISKAT